MSNNAIKMHVLLNVEGKTAVAEVSTSVKELQKNLEIAKSKSERMHRSLSNMAGISIIATNVQTAIGSLTAAMQPFIDKANAATVAQTKLKTVMEQRMEATASDVAYINKLVAAQSELGVIGGTVQRSGLQQVATFATQRETLATLLPAMNNLIAQQKGLNATNEDAVSVANLIGKALMGNVTAMTRVGVTMTEAQKEMIKTGDEGQRAATIAQVITDNVGQMNRRLAETDAGRVKQMANEFGGLQVKVGKFFSDYQNVLTGAAQVGMAVSGVVALSSAVRGLWTAFGLARIATVAFQATQASFAAMSSLVTAAINGQTMSLAAMRVGIRGTIMSLGLIGIAYMGVSTAVNLLSEHLGLFGDRSTSAAEATSKLTSAQAAQEAQARRTRSVQIAVGDAVGSVEGKFKTLQSQWKALKTTGDKTSWIKKNQSAFAALGLSVGDVNAAQRIFVSNAPRVINALKAIAEANAISEEYGKAVARRIKAGATKSVNAGTHYHVAKTGQEVSSADITKLQLGKGDYTGGNRLGFGEDAVWTPYKLTKQGAVKVNAQRNQDAIKRRNEYMAPFDDDVDLWAKAMADAENKAIGARSLLSGIGSPFTEEGKGKPGKAVVQKTDTRHPIERELDENKKKIDNLAYESVNAGEERRKEIAAEIEKLKERNAVIEDAIRLAKGEQQKEVLPTVETARGTSGLNRPTMEAWREMKQQQLSGLDLSTADGMTAAVKIEADMTSMDTLRDTVEAAIGQGIVLPADALQGLYESLFDGDNVPDGQIASWVNAINEKLMSAGLGKIEVKIDSGGVKKFISGGEEAKASWKDAARAVQSVGGALAGIEDPAMKVAGTIAQAIAEIALSFASALTKKESQAGGVWGWIAAAAAGTATMIATIASIKSATRHAAGGIVPGNTPSGDLRPVLLNSGELVLNRAQQGNLAEQLQDSRHAQDNAAMPYVTGEMIYLGLSNHLRRLGRGEIVTTRG